MKRVLLLLAIIANIAACAQSINSATSVKEVERIETTLASDEMRGRKAGTPDIDKAANFIADEFKKTGLQPLKGDSYLQDFIMLRPKLNELKLKIEGADVDMKNIIVITSQPELSIDEKSGYEFASIKAGDNLFTKAIGLNQAGKNIIVMVDTSFTKQFPRLTFLKRQVLKSNTNIVFILGNTIPKDFKIKADHSFEETKFANVVGVLPGKSKKNEYVIFAAHYDHLGIGKPSANDSIYNGANDDAAGITAVIMLADYFKKLNTNERTLVFAAFTAEELGGFGSQYFSQQMDPAKTVAMFNIEMIGTHSKWGANSAFITGYEKTDMGQILAKNLEGSQFKFYPDPYPDQQLFYRSDNATLARLGVPAHTISTSKMDSEPNYHKVTDEVSTLDMDNMARIIEAIAVSANSIISGKNTPTRPAKVM